jgi:hypothetical protein
MDKYRKGQVVVLMSLVSVCLMGAVALGTDVAVHYYNWMQLQKAVDSAVLGGANYLPDNPDQATSTAQQLAELNGMAAGEIISNTVAADHLSITMLVQRTVPYYFARLLGLLNGTVSASASAAPQFPPTTVGANNPSQIPSGGDNNGNNGTTCGGVAQCGLIPIGLDYNTAYSDNTAIVMQQGQVGAGNWDLLALGGVGGNNLRSNIANGYNGQVSVGDWVTTEPGKKVGPIDQGFQDRLALAQSVDPNGTYTSHMLTNPRVLVVPVVDWEHPNGRSTVQVKAFATVWLDGYSGGKVNVHLISQVVFNSFGDPSAPYFGSRGTPILLK